MQIGYSITTRFVCFQSIVENRSQFSKIQLRFAEGYILAFVLEIVVSRLNLCQGYLFQTVPNWILAAILFIGRYKMPVTNAKLNASHIDAIHAITESAAVLSDIFRDQQNKYDDLVTHCKAIDAEKVQCHNRAEAMKRERDTLIAEQMKREAEDEEKIIAAQQAAFAFTAQMTSYAQDDNEIRNNIANLQGQWAAFAKKWAAKDISALYQQGDAKFLEICKRSYISADERNSENGIFTQDNFPSSGRLFLLAQLAHFICWNLVNTPFFSLTGIEGEEIDGDIEDLYRPTSVLESMTNQLIRSKVHLTK